MNPSAGLDRLPGIEPRFLGLPARSLGITLTTPPWFLMRLTSYDSMLMLAGPWAMNTPSCGCFGHHKKERL